MAVAAATAVPAQTGLRNSCCANEITKHDGKGEWQTSVQTLPSLDLAGCVRTMTNFADRTIWTGDNLDILGGLNSASVDLIYLDPPFNTSRDYVVSGSSAAAGAACKMTRHQGKGRSLPKRATIWPRIPCTV